MTFPQSTKFVKLGSKNMLNLQKSKMKLEPKMKDNREHLHRYQMRELKNIETLNAMNSINKELL